MENVIIGKPMKLFKFSILKMVPNEWIFDTFWKCSVQLPKFDQYTTNLVNAVNAVNVSSVYLQTTTESYRYLRLSIVECLYLVLDSFVSHFYHMDTSHNNSLNNDEQ